jgi:hypothetical protein
MCDNDDIDPAERINDIWIEIGRWNRERGIAPKAAAMALNRLYAELRELKKDNDDGIDS